MHTHTHISSTPVSDREQALRWLLDNRRPDIPFEQALRTLRVALPRDEETDRLLQRMAEEATPD